MRVSQSNKHRPVAQGKGVVEDWGHRVNPVSVIYLQRADGGDGCFGKFCRVMREIGEICPCSENIDKD